MENVSGNTYDLYKDIQLRCGGEIYIGVVGPVRTGKSTFIKRFMDLMVLPNMEESYEKERVTDELPQSAGGSSAPTTGTRATAKSRCGIRRSVLGGIRSVAPVRSDHTRTAPHIGRSPTVSRVYGSHQQY